MTVKTTASAGNQYYYAPDDPSFTLAAAPTVFTICFIVTFDGLMTGSVPQYILSNGAFQAAGSFHIAYHPGDAASNVANKIGAYANTASLPFLTNTTPVEAGKSYLFAFTQNDKQMTVRRCPILGVEPVDGSAVVLDGTATRNNANDGTLGMFLGSRGDIATNRLFDQSFGRVFVINENLTDHELAQLAYGKEITALNKTPLWYVRLDTPDDFTNRGSSTVAFSKSGSPTYSANQPPFGFSAPVAAPVINGLPSINSTPTVGTAVGYTPASVTGSSTRSQQWTLDGVDIVGATGLNYTPIASDAGKALRVRQIEKNSGAPNGVTATSNPITVAAVTSNTITGNALTAERIYQRNGTSIPIAMAGTYAGTVPTAIEYQLYDADGAVVLKPWTVVSNATITNGTWTGTPSVPQGGMYRRQVRSMNGSTVLAQGPIETELFGVGDLFAVIGSSSAEKRFDSVSGSNLTPAANVRKYKTSWSKFTNVGCAIIEANGFASMGNIPVGMLDIGTGGTTLGNWLNQSSSYWTAFKNAVNANGGRLAGVMVFVGSNDAASGLVTSREDHASRLRTLISNIRTYTAQNSLPILLSGMNRRTIASGTAMTDEQANFVRMAERDVGKDTNVYYVQTLDFLVLASDGTHLIGGAAGFPASAYRNVYVYGNAVYKGIYYRGPEISSINYSNENVTINIAHTHATDIVPADGIKGFAVIDDQGIVNILGVSRAAPNRISLVCERPLVNPKITYMAGAYAVQNTEAPMTVMDNGATPLPLVFESDMVATSANDVQFGTFTTAELVTSGTVRANHVCNYEWHSGGVIGSNTGEITYGSKALSAQGKLIVGPLPLGPGYMLMAFPDGGVALQHGTVI